MSTRRIKFLTVIYLIFQITMTSGQIFTESKRSTHLRWKLNISKDDLLVEKKSQQISLKTLNDSSIRSIKKYLKKTKLNSPYIKNIKFNEISTTNPIASIDVTLKNNNIELFSYFNDRESQYVIDFWNNDLHLNNRKIASIGKKIIPPKSIVVVKKTNPVKDKAVVVKKVVNKKNIEKITRVSSLKGYRDFRYGASLIWSYDVPGPILKGRVDLSTKTPEYFFPIINRKIKGNEKESMIQLAINMYRKKKYGLMYKTMKLFQEKYGDDTNWDIIEYLKANAILRTDIVQGKREPHKMAINMLTGIEQRTQNYPLKRSIMKYLISYYFSNKEYIEAMKISKNYYVTSKENFDYEESEYAVQVILYTLSKLQQVDKIKKLLNDKTVKKIISKQLGIAYQIYVYAKLKDYNRVIDLYEKNKESFKANIFPSIIYNVAESYFWKADYKKSTKLFDTFVTNFSYHNFAGNARLRMAIMYEIQEKNVKETLALYKEVINRSKDFDLSFEARIRYVGLRSVRKISPTKKDIISRAFLEKKEHEILNKNLKKLLWLTRLRTYIVDKRYIKALWYLKSIPSMSLKKVERRLFEGDGSEIIYGIIVKNYSKGNYGEVIKVWNIYYNRYLEKVANDPYLNFIVGKSYIKLGLYDGFDKVYVKFSKLQKTHSKTYPHWISRKSLTSKINIIEELKLIKNIKLNNLVASKDNIKKLLKLIPDYSRATYYRGILAFKNMNYKKSIKQFESFLSSYVNKSGLTSIELLELLKKYTDSIYKIKDFKKYIRITKAITNDLKLKKSDSSELKKIKERIYYLRIEALAKSEKNVVKKIYSNELLKFLDNFKSSEFVGRVKYLLGQYYFKNKESEKGIKIYKDILNEKKIASYIKNIIKTELTLFNIKKQTL